MSTPTVKHYQINLKSVSSSSDYSKFSSGGLVATAYDGHQATIYSAQSQQINPNDHMQYNYTPFSSHNQFNNSFQTPINRSQATGLASLGYQPPPRQSLQSLNVNSGETGHAADDSSSQDEIRMRSHEILENYDVQDLLRVFNLGGGAAAGLQEDGYGFTPYTPSLFPSYSSDEERSHSSGKAVIGWLKIKAAMRWGIFVKKKAEERRAHLVELEDDWRRQ